MAFCKNCGQQIPDNANACPYCGTATGVQQAAPQQAYQPYQQAAPQQAYQPYQQAAPQYQQPYGAPVQQAYVTPEMDVRQSRGIAWLSYLGLLFLIPMFVRKHSPYTRFHVKQGATLFAVYATYSIFFTVILAIIDAITGRDYYYFYVSVHSYSTVYWIIYWVLFPVFIFLSVISIIGIINAATGKKRELFLIGKIPWIGKLLDITIYKH